MAEGNAIYSDGTSWVAVGDNYDNTNSSNILYYTTDEWHSAHMDDGSQPFGDYLARAMLYTTPDQVG